MSHKLRIELSCVEESLLTALYEVKAIMKATGETTQSLKVIHGINRSDTTQHSWVTVHADSKPEDLVKIYELEKKLAHQ